MIMRVQPRVDVLEVEPLRRETKAPTPEGTVQPIQPEETRTSVEEIAEEMDIEGAVDGMNEIVEHVHRGLRFVLHEDTNRMMVRVIDVVTDEVIKEIPPEDVLDTAARIREMIGILIDEKA